MKKLCLLLSLVTFLALAPSVMAEEVLDLPNVPVFIPFIAGCMEIAKVSVSPASQIVDQATTEYKGYPFSLVSELGNGIINTSLDIYQALAPWEWALNRNLYAPVEASVYNGGMIKKIMLK